MSTVQYAPASETGLGVPAKTAEDAPRMLLQGARERAKRKHRAKVVLACLSGDQVLVKARVGKRIETERWRT